MKISYDPKADALYIKFQEGTANRTRKVEEGMLVDMDENGRLYGIEIIGMRRMNTNMSARKSPMVPASVAISQNVG